MKDYARNRYVTHPKQIDSWFKESQTFKTYKDQKISGTLLQLMDMHNPELIWLTNHFGYTRNVYFQWYRKEDATLELKVAKVFVVVDDSQSVKNKRIDQMSSGEQEPVSSCCIRTNNSEKFWKDKSSEDS